MKKNTNKNIKKMLIKVKYNAYQLRLNNQLPSHLVYLINQLDDNCSESYIRLLMRYCEHYTRVKGYYKRYPMLEAEVNNTIISELNNKVD